MKKLMLALAIVLTAACSQSWREADPSDVDGAAVSAYLQEAQASSLGASSVDGAVVYFAHAPSSLGPVGTLLSLYDYAAIGLPGMFENDVVEARVFLLVGAQSVELIIGAQTVNGNGFTYSRFSGVPVVKDGEFTARLSGGQGGIVLSSFDVVDGGLADVIQVKLYGNDGQYLGKFSTLVGYAP